MEENKVCKYCGEELKWRETVMCNNCRMKLPLVKELVAICQEIKKFKENRNGTSKIK